MRKKKKADSSIIANCFKNACFDSGVVMNWNPQGQRFQFMQKTEERPIQFSSVVETFTDIDNQVLTCGEPTAEDTLPELY